MAQGRLACRDGAEVVATVQAYGLGEIRPATVFAKLLAAPRPGGAGLDRDTAAVAARTLVFFVLGHTGDEQVHLQAGSAAGCPTHLVRTGKSALLDDAQLADIVRQVPGTQVHADLGAFADALIQHDRELRGLSGENDSGFGRF